MDIRPKRIRNSNISVVNNVSQSLTETQVNDSCCVDEAMISGNLVVPSCNGESDEEEKEVEVMVYNEETSDDIKITSTTNIRKRKIDCLKRKRIDNFDIIWSRSYAALLEYYREHGTCNIPKYESYECMLVGMDDDGSDHFYSANLGGWLHRQQYNKATNQLRPHRKSQLQSLVDQGEITCS